MWVAQRPLRKLIFSDEKIGIFSKYSRRQDISGVARGLKAKH